MRSILTFITTKRIFFGIAFIILVTMLFMVRTAGISGDEYFHVDHSVNVLNYYKTMGTDTSALNVEHGMLHYYGQSLDTEAHFINDTFHIENTYLSRHIINTVGGWILLLFTGLIAATVFGWEAAIIALILMFLSPKILGHTWNNLKDIPFATTYTFTIYFILRFIRQLPKINWKTLAFIILGISWSLSLRVGGLILIPYLFLFTGIYFITQKSFYSKNGFVGAVKVGGILAIISVLAYFLGLILWPFGLQNPIHHPIEALKQMTNYDIGLNQLYEGVITMSKNLPWSYGIKYILITSPLVVFVGLLAFLPGIFLQKHSRVQYLLYSFLFFAFAFPIAYTIYKNSNLYGGWRHLLWTYSPIVILSAGGFAYFLTNRNKFIKYGTLAVFLALLIHPLRHTIKNHPYEYIYYNQLVGGTQGAYGKYEMDYYYHSLREGADWLIENKVGKDTITVATNHTRITEYYFRNYPQVKVIYSRYYEKSKDYWDYAIWANTHIDPAQIEKGYWPPKETIYTMDVDGQPVGAVVKRISYEDFEGFQAYDLRKMEEAKQHFRNFLNVYPENEEVLEGYARILLIERDLDSTMYYADKSLEYNPRQLGALLLKASALNAKKEYNEALKVAVEIIGYKEDFPEGHYQKAFSLKNLNNPNEALKEFQKALAYKKDYNQAFIQMGEILTNYQNYTKAIEVYDKLLALEPNDFYANVYKAKCLQLSGDNEQAVKLLAALPVANQNNVEVVKIKCRIALSKNDLRTAANYLNMARFIQTDADLFVLRAKFVLTQNNIQQAEAYVKKANELEPVNREAQELLKLFQTPVAATTEPNNSNKQTQEQQSIMFQKPTEQPTNPLTRQRK